jgi:hypothetical protein
MEESNVGKMCRGDVVHGAPAMSHLDNVEVLTSPLAAERERSKTQ